MENNTKYIPLIQSKESKFTFTETDYVKTQDDNQKIIDFENFKQTTPNPQLLCSTH